MSTTQFGKGNHQSDQQLFETGERFCHRFNPTGRRHRGSTSKSYWCITCDIQHGAWCYTRVPYAPASIVKNISNGFNTDVRPIFHSLRRSRSSERISHALKSIGNSRNIPQAHPRTTSQRSPGDGKDESSCTQSCLLVKNR